MAKPPYDALASYETESVKGKKATVTKSLATFDSYALQVYGLLSSPEGVKEEMSADLEYIEDINTALSRLASTQESHPVRDTGTPKASGFNLPKLTLPTFSGDPTTWTGFWDICECSVYRNKTLTSIQRFTYLRKKGRH